jgi:hypothetical protein
LTRTTRSVIFSFTSIRVGMDLAPKDLLPVDLEDCNAV